MLLLGDILLENQKLYIQKIYSMTFQRPRAATKYHHLAERGGSCLKSQYLGRQKQADPEIKTILASMVKTLSLPKR